MAEEFPQWGSEPHGICHCELFEGPHRHVSQDEQESAENDVPRVHHVHDSDTGGAAHKAG